MLRRLQVAIFILRPDPNEGVMRNLPEITIRVGEVSRVPAPEYLLTRLHQLGTCCNSLLQDFVNG